MRFCLIFLSLSLLLIACDFVEGAKLNNVASLTEKQSPLDVRSESLKGCSMSSLNKCYGSLPPDGSRPNNLLEEIGQVSDAQTCQSFCKDLYRGSCAWFIFDRTTNDCKLFSGSLDDLRADCKEVGYAKEPNHSSCDTVFASNSSDGCYNFREDYCRFEFSLLENLEDIETLSECQLACQYINNCSYFVYDAQTKICKLNTIASSRPTCDIVHGTPEPDFNSCVNDGHIDWASNESYPQTGQSSSNEASPVDCQWGPYGEWSNCTKDCGGGEKTRTRNEDTPATNGGQACVGNSTETETCNQEDCPSDAENRIVIIAGYVGARVSSVESLDETHDLNCNIPSYPINVYQHSSTVTPTGILVCGGHGGTTTNVWQKSCYEYHANSSTWEAIPSMTTERGYYDIIYLKQKVFAVGGKGGSNAGSTMDIYDISTKTWTKQDKAYNQNAYQHCIAQLSSNQFILIAGYHGKNLDTTWIYNSDTNSWTSGPKISIPRRHPGCFSIKKNGMVSNVVVMGGYESDRLTSTEILDVATMTWTTGPDLPIPVYDNRGVTSATGPYLGFSTGGNCDGRRCREIFGLKETSQNVYTWEEVHSMTTGRTAHHVVNAPKSILPNC